MSANFIAASSQYLANSSPPVTAYPWSAGMWFWHRAVSGSNGDNLIWLANIGSTTNYWSLQTVFSTGGLIFETNDGGGDADATTINVAAGSWYYAVIRAIAAANRRIAVLLPAGSTSHGQSTTSRTPTGINSLQLGRFQDSGGNGNYHDGLMAEFWLANADIQADGAQLQDSTLRQLAFNGPFSVPSMAGSIIDYHSFYSSIDTDKPGEVYYGGKGKQSWVNNAAVKIGPHPPLLPTYRRPDDAQSLMVI